MLDTKPIEMTRKQSPLLGMLGDIIYKEHLSVIWEILAQWNVRMPKHPEGAQISPDCLQLHFK